MIARIWRGWVATDGADAYVAYMAATGLPGYRDTPGNLGAHMLRRDLPDGRTEVVMASFWESMDAVRAFAGDDVERAVFYPDDVEHLVAAEDTVKHYGVALSATP